MLREELAKGVKQDSLLLGFKFGNTQQQFFDRCTELNKQQLVWMGAKAYVQYPFVDSTVHVKPTQLDLLFYPSFDQDKLVEMKMEFSYSAWAPWNRQYSSDSLLNKVSNLLHVWYAGNDFVIANISDVHMLVKVDGNRRLIAYTEGDRKVIVMAQDLSNPRFSLGVKENEK